MKVAFLYSQGSIANSMWLFRNGLVLHQWDKMSTLSIHFMPATITYLIRWFSVPAHTAQPGSRFPALVHESPLSKQYWMTMLALPVLLYFIWAIVYSLVNFVLCKDRIDRKGYLNLWKFIKTRHEFAFCCKCLGVAQSVQSYMLTHFLHFFVLHFVALLEFHFFWLNSALLAFYLGCVVVNGVKF